MTETKEAETLLLSEVVAATTRLEELIVEHVRYNSQMRAMLDYIRERGYTLQYRALDHKSYHAEYTPSFLYPRPVSQMLKSFNEMVEAFIAGDPAATATRQTLRRARLINFIAAYPSADNPPVGFLYESPQTSIFIPNQPTQPENSHEPESNIH